MKEAKIVNNSNSIRKSDPRLQRVREFPTWIFLQAKITIELKAKDKESQWRLAMTQKDKRAPYWKYKEPHNNIFDHTMALLLAIMVF